MPRHGAPAAPASAGRLRRSPGQRRRVVAQRRPARPRRRAARPPAAGGAGTAANAARVLVRRDAEMPVRLGRIAQPLIDGIDPHTPEAEGVGRVALAGFGGDELARLGPGRGRGQRQQRHHVDPGDGRRRQVLAPAQFGRRSASRPPRTRAAPASHWPSAIASAAQLQPGPADVDAGAQRSHAGQVAAKQQRLGQAAAQRGGDTRLSVLGGMRQQPVFQRPDRRLGKAAERQQHLLGQVGAAWAPAVQTASASKGCSTARRSAPLHRWVKL